MLGYDSVSTDEVTRYNITHELYKEILMAGYSKERASASLGISNNEFEKRAKDAGYDSTEAYWNSIGGESAPVQQAIQKEIIALDRQLEELSPYLSLSDEEKQAFLDKAIAEVTPYYDSIKGEIEAGIQEGKVRTAEDMLSTIREVGETTKNLLARYDLTQAETEEEFLDNIADLTSTTEEDLAYKKQDFRQRLEDVKFSQIQQGTLTSGIGKKKVGEEQELQTLEEQALTRRAETKETEFERERKYDLEAVQLARQDAEQRRVRLLGTPEEAAATEAAARETAGFTGAGLPGETEITRLREERGISTRAPSELTALSRERRYGEEATAQELQADELARKKQEYSLIRQKLERANSRSSSLRGY